MTGIPTLDLFSGIGGFSLGLRSVCRTIAYCEQDTTCQQILTKNIAKGLLHRAPIFQDIQVLRGRDVPGRPVFITAGFPCQDVSQSNPGGAGVHGKRSGLVKHVFRLVDELPSVDAVMLENSPNIQARGLPWVLLQFRNRNFTVKHQVFDGLGQGAPCRRSRWFLLAIRTPKSFPKGPDFSKFRWIEPPPRVIILDTPQQRASNLARCRRLGNAVIPACVAYALLSLGSFKAPPLRQDIDMKLCMTDGQNRWPSKFWRPPTYEPWAKYKTISERSTRVFSNQVFYEVKTLAYIRKHGKDRLWRVNANFVEHVMGFPQNWTAVQ